MLDIARAREAREQWERATQEGRDHNFCQAKWEAYTSMAHAAAAFMDLEHEAALAGKAQHA